MQQGNLLNNLLNLNTAATSNKPVAKAHPVNSSSGNQQDFQELMAQTRSDVAAEKPTPKPRANAATRQPSPINDKRLNDERPDTRSTLAEQPKPAAKPEPAVKSERSHAQGTNQDPGTESVSPTELLTENHEQPVDDGAQHLASSTPEFVVVGEDITSVVASLVDNPATEAAALLNQTGEGLLIDETLSSVELAAGIMLDNETDATSAEEALLAMLPDASGKVSTPIAVADSLVPGISTQLGLAGEGGTETVDDAGILELVASGLTTGSSRLSDASALQTLQGARANPLMADLSPVKFTVSDTQLQTDLLTENTESSDMDLNSEWDIPSGFTSKTNLLKTAENLVVPLEKALAADVAKPAAPTVTSLMDAFGRPQENPLGSTRSFTAQIALPQTMGHPQWSQAVGERVLWMAAQNLTAADIRLDPPELGSMQVKVSIQQDQASVSFISPHPVVREALDQQATRLREMFAEQGLNLVHVDVSDRHARQRESADEQGSGARGGKQDEEEGLQILGQSQPMNVRLVDHYA